ncbi:hypothetical protein Cgig2_000069 [Carnegiea gigantea]|uniref:Uncharacterized protein n=1 Tax=Carnegiea gigantea TaxID=171969 RepID=A0A9Q1KYZ7_9CARY|nr:hypothetical protein Cgig2_000069 [Carnegiea gigantea]
MAYFFQLQDYTFINFCQLITRDFKGRCGRICGFGRVGTGSFGCAGHGADIVRRGVRRTLGLQSSVPHPRSSLFNPHSSRSTAGPPLTAGGSLSPPSSFDCNPPSTAGGSLSSASSLDSRWLSLFAFLHRPPPLSLFPFLLLLSRSSAYSFTDVVWSDSTGQFPRKPPTPSLCRQPRIQICFDG